MANVNFYQFLELADGLSLDERLLLIKLLTDRVTRDIEAERSPSAAPDRNSGENIQHVRGEAEDAQHWISRIRQEGQWQPTLA